ncbi:MAG: hypothetical protein U0527_10170 [Candidatus Eisenbacteria bacterium]
MAPRREETAARAGDGRDLAGTREDGDAAPTPRSASLRPAR